MENIDLKSHGTTFDMDHAIMIYVLMTERVVNLPRIMRDILLVRPMKHTRNLLPYLVFISRLADRYQGELPRIRRGRLLPPRQPPPAQQAEQRPPPAASTTPSTSTQYSLEPSLHEVMWRLDRQERLMLRQGRQIANTQLMIRRAFPDADFSELEHISSDNSSESADF
ncbi:hypothetical protein PIB30_095507 [Stylosanthes scabra]|uniref:Uncharacterized protein n=1 Tax=Stylosanthes scabra TaxID=79078 RepID=A0ABU6WVA2_9FABA|nr:hypothetical protein [Stylosanthes scabra]